MSTCVVMPSIRSPNLDFLEPLGSTPLIVVDDSDGNIPKDLAPHVTVLDYSDRRRVMGNSEWLIPQKNPSCKNLGLYLAWLEGHDTIVLLDDDCDCRVSPNFLEQVPIGKPTEAHPFLSKSGWLNTMTLLGESEMWARGYPYEYRGEEMDFAAPIVVTPAFNEGLWTGTPDINGIDKFNTKNVTVERTCSHQAALGFKQLLPLSIMNVQLNRELIPAFYQPPDYLLPGHRIRRHDDVWSMLLLKHLMDLRGDVATVGAPLVWHRKEGDMIQETLSEHGANLIQPHVLEAIRGGVEYLTDGTYAELASNLGILMESFNDAPGCFFPIIEDYAQRVRAWARLFL